MNMILFRNYLKVAIRSLTQNKFYSTINILGLAVGIAVTLLISFYVLDELSYDQFHKDVDRIYQVFSEVKIGDQNRVTNKAGAPVSATFKQEIPGVEDAIRLRIERDVICKFENKSFTEKKVLYADSSFFHFFSFQLIEGDPASVLHNPHQIVLTESTALKYFGYERGEGDSPLGKIMSIGKDKLLYEVAGIVEDPPSNSQFDFDLVLPATSHSFHDGQSWTFATFFTYVKLKTYTQPSLVEKAMNITAARFLGSEYNRAVKGSSEEANSSGKKWIYFIQPFGETYLQSRMMPGGEGLDKQGSLLYVYLLSATGLLIIVIACANFMNLSTARASTRAREVGIRKTVGASRNRLMGQFILESMLTSGIGATLAFTLISIVLPLFNQISGKEFGEEVLYSLNTALTILVVLFFVGILAGSYPAFFLTAFKPAQVLKGKLNSGNRNSTFRRSLVIFQFTITICLIISTIVVFKQLKMIQRKNLGFDKENVLIIDNSHLLGDKNELFKQNLLTSGIANSVSFSSSVPPNVNLSSGFYQNRRIVESEVVCSIIETDADLLQTLDFKMKYGRFFTANIASDSNAAVINESALREFGWNDFANKTISEELESGLATYSVIGVVEDFNFQSLKKEVQPLVVLQQSGGELLSVRLNEGDIVEKIEGIRSEWKKVTEVEAFNYSFLDQNLDRLYRTEQRLGDLFMIFTVIAIFIACLGLFGLASFMAEQRSKEIGIRKVLGASVNSLISLLTKEYVKLVAVSLLIAVPVVLTFADTWLQNFAYRIDIGILIFVIGGSAALVITWLTVGYQSFRVATANPVNALRDE